jgi:hypothetical protein
MITGEPLCKSRNSSPFTEGRKEVIGTTTRILQMGNISSISLSEEKNKNLKTPTTGAQGIKPITKNNSRCINLNTELKSKTKTLHQKPIAQLRIQTLV